MFASEIRRVIESATKRTLPSVVKVLSQALVDGHVTEPEYEELQGLLDAKRSLPASLKPVRAHTGSQPRSPASMERRRRWAASGALPPGLAARFTLAEQAALAVVAAEVREAGDCRFAVGYIAALAGVGESTVRNALREARQLGLITVEERRQSPFRNLTNIVRIVSAVWNGWLRLRSRTGFKFAKGTNTSKNIMVVSEAYAETDNALTQKKGCRGSGSLPVPLNQRPAVMRQRR